MIQEFFVLFQEYIITPSINIRLSSSEFFQWKGKNLEIESTLICDSLLLLFQEWANSWYPSLPCIYIGVQKCLILGKNYPRSFNVQFISSFSFVCLCVCMHARGMQSHSILAVCTGSYGNLVANLWFASCIPCWPGTDSGAGTEIKSWFHLLLSTNQMCLHNVFWLIFIQLPTNQIKPWSHCGVWEESMYTALPLLRNNVRNLT